VADDASLWIKELLTEAAMGTRELTERELAQVIEHVALAGFEPNELETVRGRLAGITWNGRTLRGNDRLPAEEVHYLRHVILRQEWPVGTALEKYIASIRRVVRDPHNGLFTSRYQSAWQLGVIRESGELRGPLGSDFVLVEFRITLGHWVTAYQPADVGSELQNPGRGELRWLRRLPHLNA